MIDGPIAGVLLDLDGVLLVSGEPVPGAADAVERLQAAGLRVRVLTNTTSRSRAGIGAELRQCGLGISDEQVLTAAVSAATFVRAVHPDGRVFLLGDAQPADLRGLHLVGIDDDPDVILLSGANPSFAFDNLNRVYRILLEGAAFVAMHRSLSWTTRDGECLDLGSYLLGLERATGREAVIVGKPAAHFFATGVRALDLPPAQVAMVGDDLETDVLAAQAAGLTGVLVRTGKFRDSVLAQGGGAPDHVVGSIADVPGLLGC